MNLKRTKSVHLLRTIEAGRGYLPFLFAFDVVFAFAFYVSCTRNGQDLKVAFLIYCPRLMVTLTALSTEPCKVSLGPERFHLPLPGARLRCRV